MPKKQQNQTTELVTMESKELASATPGGPIPSLILDTGRAGQTAWDDFFTGWGLCSNRAENWGVLITH